MDRPLPNPHESGDRRPGAQSGPGSEDASDGDRGDEFGWDGGKERASPLRALMQMRPGEGGIVLLSALYIFCTLAGYYILRPIRDEISASDRENLHLLWTIVFLVMLIVVPLYAFLTERWPRRRFVSFVYHFFALNIIIFYVLIDRLDLSEAALIGVDRVFYIWVSVFNLFVVSVFWQMMADIHNSEQAKRLFGLIAVGGTLGAILGSGTVSLLLSPPKGLEVIAIKHTTLLLFSALLLEGACVCIYLLNRATAGHHARQTGPSQRACDEDGDTPVEGGVWEGLSIVFRSPYLLLICAFIALFCTLSTFAYFQQADILRAVYHDDRDGRRVLLANIDLAVNGLTVFIQCFLAGRIMTRLGVGVALAALPFVAMAGFALLALGHARPEVLPVLAILIAFQVGRRTANFALAKPARETLFTVVPRAQKYKAKALIDNAVYRGSDTAGSWFYTGLQALGLSMLGVALVAVPLAGAWLIVALILGRMQQQRSKAAMAQ